jgi:AcrR family transcriptional regulator
MGLREMKAARSRQQMADVAIDLFLRDGYDETTMEQIAEQAEVGTTTLYRYYPTKDQLLLDPLIEAIDPTPHLRARPAQEPLDVALGEAMLAAASAFDGADDRIVELRRLVDATAVVRAKLWDRYQTVRQELEAVIADRAGSAPTDLSVRASAGLVLAVMELVDRARLQGSDPRTHREVVSELLDELSRTEIVVPHLPRIATG